MLLYPVHIYRTRIVVSKQLIEGNEFMSVNKTIKGHCIICHADDVVLTDEHVIPDSLGGYIHCYKVCKDCNSRLGDHVDKQLLDHFLIKGLRHIHQLKGKTNFIPNPLAGDAVLNTGEKVRIEDVNGVITPRILPTSPVISSDNSSGIIKVDIRDEKYVPAMKKKMLDKMGVNPDEKTVVTTREIHQIAHPVVKIESVIDLKNFKIGLLKIAYELCVESFPQYEYDELGQLYAEILRSAAIDRLDEVKFVGDGFHDPLEPILSQFIDYSNKKRHIVILFNNEGHLCCLVKLFDSFSQFIQMSESPYLAENDMRFYFNDFAKHGSETFTLQDLLAKVSEENTTSYYFDQNGMALMEKLSKEGDVGFHANQAGDNLVFDQDGKAIMTESMLKNSLSDGMNTEYEVNDGLSVVTYHLPNGLYFMVSPSESLIQVVVIKETTKIHKY